MSAGKNSLSLEKAAALYHAGFTFRAIAQHFAVSHQAVHQLLVKHGIHVPRKPPEPDYAIVRKIFEEMDARLEPERRRYIAFTSRKMAIQAKAHALVTDAVCNGRLVAQPCEVCQSTKRKVNGDRDVHAHHDDYSEPLEVRWLCSKHHSLWHSKNEASYGALLDDLNCVE